MHGSAKGRLVLVGCGLQPGRHASQRTISEILRAGVVFGLTDPFAIDWLRRLNDDVRNLAEHYSDDRDRRESYRDMQTEIVEAVREGQQVCVVLYGHPGVFAQVGRKAMRKVGGEGFETRMEPGISAEACLYADLDMDPGEHGVQSLEATQFMIQARTLDPAAVVLLWQVSLAGNLACVGFDAHRERLKILVDKLRRWYRVDTQVILYEAATLPILDFRAERIRLDALPDADLNGATTLVIPPTTRAEPDRVILDRLAVIG